MSAKVKSRREFRSFVAEIREFFGNGYGIRDITGF